MPNLSKWCLVLCVLATGCIQTTDEYILNPDGSGKVKHTAVLQSMNTDLSDPHPDLDRQMRQAVAKELSESAGVDAWKDAGYARTSEGQVRFWGTAYFRDIQALKIRNGGFQSNFLIPVLTHTPTGLVLDLKDEKTAKPTNAAAPPLPKTEAETQERVKLEKAKFQQVRPMMVMALTTLKVEKSFVLPGKVSDAGGLQTAGNNTLKVTFEGAKVLELLDQLIKDDSWWQEMARTGKNLNDPDALSGARFSEKMFGSAQPLHAVVSNPLVPQFDYATEVAAAKTNYTAMLNRLKLTADTVGVAATMATAGAPFKSVKVGGVRLISQGDRDNDVRPLNYDPEYTLALVAQFDGAVREVTGGELSQAIADTGESLLPARDWDRKISFPRLSKDKTVVIYELKLKQPTPAVQGLKELSGHIDYLTGGATKLVDLGLTAFSVGATGTEYAAAVKSVGTDKWNKEKETLELELHVPKYLIKAVTFFDDSGAKLTTTSGSTMGNDNYTTLGYSLTNKFPARGRIEVEVFTDLQKHTVPFSLADISLLGRPLR